MQTFSDWVQEHWAGTQRYVRAAIFTIFNLHVVYSSIIALASVYITSDKVLDIQYKVDTFFLSLGVTFPLVFAIQAAFGRREQASKAMANLKAHSLSFYLLHRDWDKSTPGDLSTAGDNNTSNAVEARILLGEFLQAVRGFLLRSNRHNESCAEERWRHVNFNNSWLSMLVHSKVKFSKKTMLSTFDDPTLLACYESLSRLSILNEKALVRWGYLKSGESPTASRMQLALTALFLEFEQLRTIRDYRTPVMLRYGNKVLVQVVSLFLGPYFNTFCYRTDGKKVSPNCQASYIVAFLFVVTITLLTRIAKDIEYPFDMEGMDDLFFSVDHEVEDFTNIDVGGVEDLFNPERRRNRRTAAELTAMPSTFPMVKELSSLPVLKVYSDTV